MRPAIRPHEVCQATPYLSNGTFVWHDSFEESRGKRRTSCQITWKIGTAIFIQSVTGELWTAARTILTPGAARFCAGGASALGAALGMTIPFERNLPMGLIPVALAQDTGQEHLGDKDGLSVLSDRPLNAEVPAYLLDDDLTPYEHLFIRMNGLVPQTALDGDAAGWTVTIDGEVDTPLELSIEDLKSGFENVTSALVLECGGNGRAFFNPGASGNQWTTGAVGCPEWTGAAQGRAGQGRGQGQRSLYRALRQ